MDMMKTPEPMQAAGQVAQPTMIEGLIAQEERLSRELATVRDAIAALQKHPEVAEALNAISKVTGRY